MRIAMIAYSEFESDARVRRAVQTLADRGHTIDLLCIASPVPREEPPSARVRISRLRMSQKRAATGRYILEYGAFFMWSLALVTTRHLRRRYQVVYVHNMPNFLVFAGLIPKLTGARIVLDVHDPAPELLASIKGGQLPAWVSWLARAEERASLSFADAVITVNESMRRRLDELSPGLAPVTVVMNLPDAVRFAPEAPNGNRAPGPLLVYSGSIAERNGLDLVVEAMAELADDFPALRLRLIGDGPAAPHVANLARQLGVSDRIDFLGIVPNEEIPPLIREATAGVSPHREDVFGSLVFSMKVAEYVALELPVVCSGIATMRHYFSDDELWFFEPGNAEDMARSIRELLASPDESRDRAQRARRRLEKLDWSAQQRSLACTVESNPRR
ncbi:MAG TPA: glycosyltransferase family 4 protein [Actinomycetota bacterium]|nr:glycosyltransferase family 4 protein [Actinomycetota bacterium]